VCDATLATAVPGVVAAGDVARWPNLLFEETMRIEHWTNAVDHRLFGGYLSDRVAAGELRPHDSRAVVQALFSACAFGHIAGQPIDPLAVAQIVLEGIEAPHASGHPAS
jgi:hypothetical protein